jgi:polyribonucleotide nucleotidyltransferase
MESKQVRTRIGRQELVLETGKIAKQADGSVLLRYGDTVVLVAAVSAPARPDIDFFPLRVDYREMTYAAGKFPGGFFKREGRPTTKEILTGRLMDRPIRPLFPDGYMKEVMITSVALSADLENDPDILSMIGASASLCLSPNIPFLGPVGSVRIGKLGDEFIVNPTAEERAQCSLELVVSGTEDAIAMIEGSGQESSEADMLQAILTAQQPIREIVRIQRELAEMMGVRKEPYPEKPADPLLSEIEAKYFDRIMAAHQVPGKFPRQNALNEIFKAIGEEYAPADGEVTASRVKGLCEALEKRACRTLILQGRREDGRALNEVRDITCEVGVLPRVHGSALFTRGETQALVTCTLGTSSDEQRVDGLGEEFTKKFMLDYNFPPFCVGEAKPPRSPSRREIGHGNLAETSVRRVLPPVEKFPYTIRVVSDIMESNGSSSQASVCGATLCLMDAGVPLLRPVAGVAMGLVSENGQVKILTDICGAEDHFGDMDLKIAGTQNGITGIQMDLKVRGIKEDTLMEAFTQARAARVHVLQQMLKALPSPRTEISRHAPRLLMIKIPVDKIGAVIGPGGRIIKKIQEDTGAKIDIEDDGTVNVSSRTAESAERARDIVRGLTAEPEVGTIYLGKVTGIKDFGAFVEILPGRDGLVHVSELSDTYVKQVDEICKLGDEMLVKVLSIDDQGKIRLSRKAALKDRAQKQAAEGGAQDKPAS